MNVSLELPPELENELLTEAGELQLPLTEYILRVLSFRPLLKNPPTTGSELVTYWQSAGIVGSRPDITDSQEYADRLRSEVCHDAQRVEFVQWCRDNRVELTGLLSRDDRHC